MTTDIPSSAKTIVTSICPSCGCSLIRLGIGADRWAKSSYEGKEYFFCCQGCADLFNQEPPRYLQETKDLVVCPTCLAEKPVQWTARMEIAGWEVFFADVPIARNCFERTPITTSNVYKVRSPMTVYSARRGVVPRRRSGEPPLVTCIAFDQTPLLIPDLGFSFRRS